MSLCFKSLFDLIKEKGLLNFMLTMIDSTILLLGKSFRKAGFNLLHVFITFLACTAGGFGFSGSCRVAE